MKLFCLRLRNNVPLAGTIGMLLLIPSPRAQAQTAWDSQQNTSLDCSSSASAGSAACLPQNQSGTMPNQLQQQQTNFVEPLAPGQPPSDTSYTDSPSQAGQPMRRPMPRQMMRLPPEPLTEFQRFAALTTGTVLPIFGNDLFRNVPSTFAPLDLTPVPPDHVIGAGDEVRIHVWGQVNFKADLRVDRSGEIYIPQVGGIQVAGLSFSALEQHLRDAISRVYRNFDLTADIGRISAIQVYVTGEARRPGLYTVSSLSTLADAIFASGGPSVEGSMRHIQLRRGGSQITDFDLYNLIVHGDKTHDVKLLSGDVIFIPNAGPRVAVLGSVRHPAIYELRDNETVGQLLLDAGGASSVAAQARISIERIQDHRTRNAFEAAFDTAGLGIPLTDGDIVRILSIVPRYQQTVTLRGNTANPGRFGWHSGMRLSDLIPDRDSLMTRNYWWERTQLGLPAHEFEPLERLSDLRQPSTSVDLRTLRQSRANSTPDRRESYEVQQESAPGGQWNQSNDTDSARSQTSQDWSEQQPLQQDNQYPSADPSEQSYNTPAQQQAAGSDSSLSTQRSRQFNSNSSALASQQSDVVTENVAGESQRTDVRLRSPEIDWDYAVIERMDPNTLKSSLIPFDLGRLVMGHDSSQNLELQPGDVVTVFSQADIHVPLAQQTKYVRLEGEFVHAGIYSVQPGETLRELVRRAGGLTQGAYLYGSEFTRESTRITQQNRINEYVHNLEIQIERGSLSLASSPLSTAQDIASASAAENSEHELIALLQHIRATGRIVLELKADTSSADNLPNIDLEDGDRFVVPSVPATVNVVGAVYEQGSFLYQQQRDTGDYLRLAGGPNRDADTKHNFIIRADGSVVSRPPNNGLLWANNFNQLRMHPGDTVVMPEKTLKGSALRGFLDWSQVFSQLALGAAAINILR